MVNRLRKLYVKDIVPDDIPKDVVEVDILYKESNSPNIYVVDTAKKNDAIIDGEISNTWNYINVEQHVLAYHLINSPPINILSSNKGKYEITSEILGAVLPSNQLLRPWDNVPRKALAQEVTGNRLVYGNYLQNYNLTTSGGENFKPDFEISFGQYTYKDEQGELRTASTAGNPGKSLKSMR